MKILIVDDSRAMRMILMRGLRQVGLGEYEIIEASNGTEALASIRENGPDLVISDWNMAEMTGIELLEAVRAERLPVKMGLVTTEATAEMREQALALGAAFYITKPFTVETLQEAVSSVLG